MSEQKEKMKKMSIIETMLMVKKGVTIFLDAVDRTMVKIVTPKGKGFMFYGGDNVRDPIIHKIIDSKKGLQVVIKKIDNPDHYFKRQNPDDHE